jgi:uracil-DNA glycosylase
MLNTCLTVRSGEANSHANKGWETFTQNIIDIVVRVRSRGVVFLAWGNPAQKRCAGIKSAKHIVLKSIHPSPLAQTRGSFTECGHFKQTNEWLEERYGPDGVIDWSLNKSKHIAAPAAETPVKVTETQHRAPEGAGPATEVLQAKDDKPIKDEFEELDEEDALEALEAVERSRAAGED